MAIDQINATLIIKLSKLPIVYLEQELQLSRHYQRSNNVKTEDDWKAIANINHMIRQIAVISLSPMMVIKVCLGTRIWKSHQSSIGGECQEFGYHELEQYNTI